jgi:hypothetical protein
MDSERAETHLRRIAEAELRRALSPAPDLHRVMLVGRALTKVGALDEGIADAIQADLEMAVALRQPLPPQLRPGQRRQGQPRRGPGRSATSAAYRNSSTITATATGITVTAAGSLQSRRRATVPEPLVPLTARIPVALGGDNGQLRLLAYSRTSTGAWFAVHAWNSRTADPVRRSRHFGHGVLDDLTMTDDAGNGYRLGFSGGGGPDGYVGCLTISPEPPLGLRWAEISQSGGPATRFRLDPPGAMPPVMVTRSALTPAEHLLIGYATSILNGSGPTALLGDVVTALRAAGALSPLSPVPGQLAALCEHGGFAGHGIDAPPAPGNEIPEHWLSDSRAASLPYPADKGAAIAVTLPEVDGIRLSLLGLTNTKQDTLLHVHVVGVAQDIRDSMPFVWLRDESHGWRTTRISGWSRHDDEGFARLSVWPPLSRCSAADVLICGQSAEVRVSLALDWR